MPSSLAKFRLNGKELSLKLTNKSKLVQFLKRLPFPEVIDRTTLSEKLHISYEDNAFKYLPDEFKHKISARQVVYGSPATIKALKKELAHANN